MKKNFTQSVLTAAFVAVGLVFSANVQAAASNNNPVSDTTKMAKRKMDKMGMDKMKKDEKMKTDKMKADGKMSKEKMKMKKDSMKTKM